MVPMIERDRKKGGRAYAVGIAAIRYGTFVVVLYLLIVVWYVDPVTAPVFAPLGWFFAGLFGVGGAMQVPNAAERWRGGYTPYDPPGGASSMEEK